MKTHLGSRDGAEGPDLNPRLCAHPTSDRARNTQWGKDVSLVDGAGKTKSHVQRNETRALLHTEKSTQHGLGFEWKTCKHKTPRRKQAATSSAQALAMLFGSDTKSKSNRTNKCSYVKLNSLCTAQETKEMGRQPTNGSKCLQIASGERLRSKTHELYNSVAKKQSDLKVGRSELKFAKEDIRMANRHMERCSASPSSGTCHQNHDEIPPPACQNGRQGGRREQEPARVRARRARARRARASGEPRARFVQECERARPRWTTAARSFRKTLKPELPCDLFLRRKQKHQCEELAAPPCVH